MNQITLEPAVTLPDAMCRPTYERRKIKVEGLNYPSGYPTGAETNRFKNDCGFYVSRLLGSSLWQVVRIFFSPSGNKVSQVIEYVERAEDALPIVKKVLENAYPQEFKPQ